MRFGMLSLGLLASALTLGGCVAQTGDEPAVSDSEDVTASPSGVFVATANEKAGGDIAFITTVARPNMKTTKCDDGKLHATCVIGSLDVSALHLTPAKQLKLEEAFRAGHALVKGTVVAAPKNLPLTVPHMARIVVTKAWLGAGGNDVGEFDTFYVVKQRAMACAGCATVLETLLNSTKNEAVFTADIANVTGASKTEIAAGNQALQVGGDGLIAAGINHTLISCHPGPGNGCQHDSNFVATDFYLPVQ